jgi:hypothetical protein
MPTKVRENLTLRRLGFVKDPEGKVRVVAMYDYWTQTVLRPLHLYIIKMLGTWFRGTDVSKNQQDFKNLVPRSGTTYYCFDLVSATDRFPLSYQKVVMEA